MAWIQVMSLFLANAGLIFWMRSESRADWKHLDAKTDEMRAEMKDFHGRLCALEERYINWLMREK